MQLNTNVAFYLANDNSEEMQKPSAFIFDETYKSKYEKSKFAHNPKFAYFNAVMKIRNKLGNNKH